MHADEKQLREFDYEYWGVDGKYSPLSDVICDELNAEGLILNECWANTPMDFKCPTCHRGKVDIARKGERGRVICKLEGHHDHYYDVMKKIITVNWPDEYRGTEVQWMQHARNTARRIADQAILFEKTIVCEGCNGAEAERRYRKFLLIPDEFSFPPVSMREFLVGRPHETPRVDYDAARDEWNRVRGSHEARCEWFNFSIEKIRDAQYWMDNDRDFKEYLESTISGKVDGIADSIPDIRLRVSKTVHEAYAHQPALPL